MRDSSAGKPTQRVGTVLDTPNLTPSFDTPSPAGMASYTSGGYETSALPISTAATVSLVFGILGWFMAPVIGSIIAIVTGTFARRKITESNGQLGGSNLAKAGIIMGYIQLVLTALCIILYIAFVIWIINSSLPLGSTCMISVF
ncbi:DUF4190 domain-containing protein [Roseiflexus sp.]|uniref:DUF4190 domain-containing protein n=1 Tax=Roseiflexus sp. TaxID=2562120 RepID=UPI00398B5202